MCQHRRERPKVEEPKPKPKKTKIAKHDEESVLPQDGAPEEASVPKKRRIREGKKPKEVRRNTEEEVAANEPESDFSDYLKKVGELLKGTKGLESELVETFVRDLASKYGFSSSHRWVEGDVLMKFNKAVLEIHRKLSSKEAIFRDLADEYLNSNRS